MPFWDLAEEPWRRFLGQGTEQPQYPGYQSPQWGFSDWWGRLTEPVTRGWREGGWLTRLLGPLAQAGYWAERAAGALGERITTPAVGTWRELAGEQDKYFDFVNTLSPEIKSIVNRETRRAHWSGWDARLAAGQEMVESGDYSPENITSILERHQEFWPELVGNIIFDPLNFAGFVLKPLGLTKAGRQALVGKRAMEAVEILPELSRIDKVKDWLLTPLSKSLDDQGTFMVYLHRAAADSDEAGELIAKLQRLKNPDELTRIFADVADKDRIFLSETSRRKFLGHLDNIDLDAIDVAEKGVSEVVDEVAGMLTDATEAYHGVGDASALERFNRRVKSIIGIPLIGMNPAVASKNIINAAVTGVWDEGAMPLAETLKALPGRGDAIRDFFAKEGLDPKTIEEWIFRGFAGAPETGAAGGFIGKITVPGRIMRFMERFQGAATFKAGYVKTWDALYGNIAPQLAPEIIQQLGPHADDFASLIRHSNPGNIQAKVTAFLKAIESPEAVAKPLASYVDQLPPGIAAHWEEMLAPWAKEGLEIEGKSLDEALEIFRQMDARIADDVATKVAADGAEALEGFGDDLFDADGWLRGRDRMWPEVPAEIPGEMPTRPFPAARVPDEARPLMTDEWSALVGRLRPPKKLLQGWIDEAAELGHTPGGAFIKRGPTTGVPKWSWLHDNGRLHAWNRLVEWAEEVGKIDELTELGARAIEPEDFARVLIPEDILAQASGATEAPSLSRLAQVQQKTARSIFEELERIVTADLQKPRGMTADVVDFVNGEVLPAMHDAQTGSLMVADLIRNDVMLNYTRRMRFDPWLDLVFPYHFWFDRSMGNWLRRIMANPAQAALYAKLRAHIIEKDRDLPTRLRGSLPFVVDKILPNWAVNMIFLNPEKALIPFPTIFKEEPYKRPEEQLTPLGRGMEQMQNILPMYPSPLIQYPLALTGALGAPEQWVSGPQTPPGRLIRAASATGWGRELGERMGFEVPPTGINIEAPLLRAAGIQEVPTWEKEYWPLKHLALMAEQGEITQDEAVEAMRTQSGPLWEEAQRRTSYQKAWPTLTGALGFPTEIRPGMEQEVTEARRGQREAESYARYREYFEEHPGIGLTNLAWNLAGGEGFREEAKEWLQWYDYRQYKEERDSLVDEYILENPGDTKGLGELTQALRAKRPVIPDREFQRHFKMTDDEWAGALRENLIWRTQEFRPDYDDFEQFGYGQWDAYNQAQEEFYRQVESGETPWMQEIIREAAEISRREALIKEFSETYPDDTEAIKEYRARLMETPPAVTPDDLEEAEDFVLSLIGGEEGIQRQFREYDSPPEAAQRIYKDSYIDAAYEARDAAYGPWGAWQDTLREAGLADLDELWDQYHSFPEGSPERRGFWKVHPELKAYMELKEQYQAEHPEAVWENVEAQVAATEAGFGPIEAVQLIPQIMDIYKERGWTEEELREALGAPVDADILSFLRAGKASHPDEQEPREEYDAMIRALTTGQGIPRAIAIAQSHLDAHRNALLPTERDTVHDPYPGEPEKNEAAVRGFETVIEALRGRPELGGLTFPGFATYREMQRRAERAVPRETPTAPGAAAQPAVGGPQQADYYAVGKGWEWNPHFQWYQPPLPRPRGRGGYQPYRQPTAYRQWQRSPWWDWGPLQERFGWRI